MSAGLDAILLENSGGILFLVDPASLVIGAASTPTLRLLGYSRDEFVGRNVTDIECSLAGTCYWDDVRQGGAGEVHGAETSYRCADGGTLAASKTVTRAFDGDKAWLAVRSEPTGLQQRVEDELVLVTSRLRATLEATAEGILLVDRTGRIVNMNRRFSRIWGLPESLLLANDDGLIFGFMTGLLANPGAYQERLAAISPCADEETFDVLHLIDGRVFERRSMPARSAEQIFGRVYSFSDISERRRNEAARNQLQAQLRESQKMEALGMFAGGVAHDFNNIIAAIMGNVELACQDTGPEHPALESLDEIRKSSQRAKDLVRQILAFGRRERPERALISLAPVVTESTGFVRAMLPAGTTLDVSCAAGVRPVLANANQIQQVLLNLCGNAWQALQGRALPGSIEIRLEERIVADASPAERERRSSQERVDVPPGRYTCLVVRDNGCGMDAATRARIFEPFFTTKPAGAGTGLGLSVVHAIVRDHDAKIEVRSDPGEGTTFCVYFPAIDAPPRAIAPAKADAAPVSGAGKHVLYVDDEDAIIFMMTRMLERLGYRVSGYTDPQAALAAARNTPDRFDLVVTDYNMPGMSGLDMARELRKIRPDLPVALASGYITDELRQEAPAAGVVELIYKPHTADELCAAVARIVKARRGDGGIS